MLVCPTRETRLSCAAPGPRSLAINFGVKTFDCPAPQPPQRQRLTGSLRGVRLVAGDVRLVAVACADVGRGVWRRLRAAAWARPSAAARPPQQGPTERRTPPMALQLGLGTTLLMVSPPKGAARQRRQSGSGRHTGPCHAQLRRIRQLRRHPGARPRPQRKCPLHHPQNYDAAATAAAQRRFSDLPSHSSTAKAALP